VSDTPTTENPTTAAQTGDGWDEVVAALGRAVPGDPAELAEPVLADRMRQLVQLRARVDAVLVDQLRVFDARGGAGYDGQSSTAAWTRSRLRLGRDAGELLAVARHLAGLPMVAKAFAAGEMSLEHAAAVARLASKVGAEQLTAAQPTLVELARNAPPKQLRILCEHLAQLLDPDGDANDRKAQHRRRYLSAGRTLDGMVHLQGLLDAAAGDVVLAALTAAMPPPAEYEERTPAQRRADALTDIAAGWLAAGQAPTAGGIRPQVQVTISWRTLRSWHPLGADTTADHHARTAATRARNPYATLPTPTGWPSPSRAAAAAATTPAAPSADGPTGVSADRPDGTLVGDVPVLADGQPISPAEARRLACDAQIIPVVLGTGGEVLDIGRASRVVPVGLRRALNLRDGGCRFPGCDRPASWCDAHHIQFWADGGPTNMDNCALLCAYHHTVVHEGWMIYGNPNGTLRFHRPDGTRLDLASDPRSSPPTRGP
jgi:hypothetical protein